MRFVLLYILLSIIFPIILFAQEENNYSSDEVSKNLFENAMLQVENLIITQSPTDSLIFYLLSDAKNFGNKEYWRDGYEILNTILEIYGEGSVSVDSDIESSQSDNKNLITQSVDSTISNYPYYPTFPFQLEVGVDYSLQEFELSFVENDSTIVEELQNPYIGLLFNHTHILGNQTLSFNHRFRLDNQFIYYSLFGSYQSNKLGNQNRLDFESYFYHQDSKDNADFLDNQLRYTWSNSDYGERLFYINLRGRYKTYFQQDSLNSDIFSTALNSYYEHFFNSTNSFYLNIIPELYQEQKDLGLSYFQTRAGTFYRIRKNYNQYYELGAEIIYRDFKDDFSDVEYQNKYLSLEPRLEGEFPFNPHCSMSFKMEFENRNYQTADEINPNFIYFNGEGLFKYYWEDFKSAGLGYFFEKQNHRADDDLVTPLVEQENFYSYGIIVNLEIMNFSGFLLSLEYRLSMRTYPDSQESLFYAYYSDRFVHSINAFGWIPIGDRWQVQLFANYDNDQDRENEQNDNRSTVLNVGLIYKF